LFYRRHNEERELCWRDVCPELYFGSGGWLEPELYVVDGPESEPTANREGSRIRISGVQQGDAIIAEEQSTPGKLKGRGDGPTLRMPGESQFKLDDANEYRVSGYDEIH
jgi:hypothetical protein